MNELEDNFCFNITSAIAFIYILCSNFELSELLTIIFLYIIFVNFMYTMCPNYNGDDNYHRF